MKYEAVIGLEIHVQLKTNSKAFCADSALYGEHPNEQVSAISLGYPGTLPMHNIKAIEFATRLGLALNCEINRNNQYARKNYFYADLPKGYQITQDKTPICKGGFVEIADIEGNLKKVKLTRIHMEEDSGKSMHDQDLYDSLIDYNRAGIPLVEIVSEPDIKNGDEAYQFVSEIRRLVRYLDICDGNMEEGSLRCDANISVMPLGSKVYGTKVEVKNMNSMTNVKRAIEFEIQRQIEILENGATVVSETRSFNAAIGNTISMRSKENAQDYLYFPEPDLPPFIVTESFLNNVKQEMPILPKELSLKLQNEYGLSDKEAAILVEDKSLAEYFLNLASCTSNYKSAYNWLMGAIKSWLNENAKSLQEFPLSNAKIAELISMIDADKVSHSAASGILFPKLIENPASEPMKLAESLNLIQTSDKGLLNSFIEEVVAKYPEKVIEYKSGKKGLLGLFVGEVMKMSKGAADPKTVNKLLLEKLDA